MKSPLLEPPRVVIAAAFVALALGLGNAAAADAPVTEKQAEAAALHAATEDAAPISDAPDDTPVNGATEGFDLVTTETIIWSAPGERPAALAWYPPFAEGAAADTLDLTLSASPMQSTAISPAAVQGAITNEHTVIPLPPAAWTGLAGLASLATIGGRKAIVRFFT